MGQPFNVKTVFFFCKHSVSLTFCLYGDYNKKTLKSFSTLTCACATVIVSSLSQFTEEYAFNLLFSPVISRLAMIYALISSIRDNHQRKAFSKSPTVWRFLRSNPEERLGCVWKRDEDSCTGTQGHVFADAGKCGRGDVISVMYIIKTCRCS